MFLHFRGGISWGHAIILLARVFGMDSRANCVAQDRNIALCTGVFVSIHLQVFCCVHANFSCTTLLNPSEKFTLLELRGDSVLS